LCDWEKAFKALVATLVLGEELAPLKPELIFVRFMARLKFNLNMRTVYNLNLVNLPGDD
jgi:hypothetical protein